MGMSQCAPTHPYTKFTVYKPNLRIHTVSDIQGPKWHRSNLKEVLLMKLQDLRPKYRAQGDANSVSVNYNDSRYLNPVHTGSYY